MAKVYTNNVNLSHQKCSKYFKSNFTSAEDLFLSKFYKRKEKKFLFFPEENLEFTYNEFFLEYKKISQILSKKKFKKKDRISK